MRDADAGLTIAAVERDTGISKDTLRVWERRYGFPVPGRNPFGERTYPSAQVTKLRIVKRLLDAGFRPGRVVGLALDELVLLAGPDAERSAAPVGGGAAKPALDVQVFLDLLRAHDVEGLRRKFDLQFKVLAKLRLLFKPLWAQLLAVMPTINYWKCGEKAAKKASLSTKFSCQKQMIKALCR